MIRRYTSTKKLITAGLKSFPFLQVEVTKVVAARLHAKIPAPASLLRVSVTCRSNCLILKEISALTIKCSGKTKKWTKINRMIQSYTCIFYVWTLKLNFYCSLYISLHIILTLNNFPLFWIIRNWSKCTKIHRENGNMNIFFLTEKQFQIGKCYSEVLLI